MNKYAVAKYFNAISQTLHLINNTFVSAFTRGDPGKLLSPTDSKGLKCGLDPGVTDKPYLFFFDLTKCAVQNAVVQNAVVSGCRTPQVCQQLCFTW
jgi:choline transporter-like protein 2/4/5